MALNNKLQDFSSLWIYKMHVAEVQEKEKKIELKSLTTKGASLLSLSLSLSLKLWLPQQLSATVPQMFSKNGTPHFGLPKLLLPSEPRLSPPPPPPHHSHRAHLCIFLMIHPLVRPPHFDFPVFRFLGNICLEFLRNKVTRKRTLLH